MSFYYVGFEILIMVVMKSYTSITHINIVQHGESQLKFRRQCVPPK